MRISFDPAKRDRTLKDRGLAFEDAIFVFEGTTFEFEDSRKDYSLRKANDREKARLEPYFEV